MLLNPSEGLFVGAFPIGAASLIDMALIINQNWGFKRKGFIFTLWGFWWIDLGISFITAFGMIYTMMYTKHHFIAETTSVWVLPIIPLIVLSSTGGNLSRALFQHSRTLAVITVGFSLNAFVVGMSITLMVITLFLTRLIMYGPPKAPISPAGFIITSPLGQGGVSLLVNGGNLAQIFPTRDGDAFPGSILSGEMLYAVCLSGAWILWSMGIAWVIISVAEIYITSRTAKIPFTLAYWGLVFPIGVFALCSVRLGVALESRFFHYFGAIWSST
ncbi:voltage-dependent anion channel [Crucibulum laeve]|uniref:Voltage-dependent anion channel n=1 Tax=Crucibulum laeve TaxID=68775 RepID=A0A5C3MHM7_9AGAR|nr:voltage-dependent anion channel [Crucibulum laeve]